MVFYIGTLGYPEVKCYLQQISGLNHKPNRWDNRNFLLTVILKKLISSLFNSWHRPLFGCIQIQAWYSSSNKTRTQTAKSDNYCLPPLTPIIVVYLNFNV